MDAITVPIVKNNTPLQDAWNLMRERGCANVLVQKGNGYFTVSDQTIAEAIARGARSLKGLSGTADGIQVLSPVDFKLGSSEVFSTGDLRRMHRSIERALSPFVGVTQRRTKTPEHFAKRLTNILDARNLEIAVVGVQFDTATVFSVSEDVMIRAGITHGGPGRFLCSCNGAHLWQPHQLDRGCCPLDGCDVEFGR